MEVSWYVDCIPLAYMMIMIAHGRLVMTSLELNVVLIKTTADLHQIIKSGQSLTNEHVQYFMYQILRGTTLPPLFVWKSSNLLM